jgi:hypothetical protein
MTPGIEKLLQRRNGTWIAIAAIAFAFAATTARAADHADGPRASADPSADITDLFAWTSPDTARVNLVMDLVRNATPGSKFSDSVKYVFHMTSSASFGAPPSREIEVVCKFDRRQRVKCRVGGRSRVSGDASGLSGITSRDGKLRVFTGLRDDPFFFNLAGFRATAQAVTGAAAAGGLTFDAAGCPALDATTAQSLVNQLRTAPGGGPAVDGFAHFNVLAIVLSIDKSLLTRGGPILAVWASTERATDDCDDDRGRHGDCAEDDDEYDYDVVQIDRMGRPGVNTALTNPFFRESVPSEVAHHESVVDAYNADPDPSTWVKAFAPEIAGNLAILDSLDTVCGNQLLSGPSATPGRYDALAGVLADDQLYVNTSSGSCGQYLAVEANYLGIKNNDCGGRTPLEDTIDTTYSLLAEGRLSGVTDGIPSDGDGTASLSQFPFLDHPN